MTLYVAEVARIGMLMSISVLTTSILSGPGMLRRHDAMVLAGCAALTATCTAVIALWYWGM